MENNEAMNNEAMNYMKIEKAFKNSIKLHITLKNKSWRNGYVLEVKPDFCLFVDDVNEVEPIFYCELNLVRPYTQDKK